MLKKEFNSIERIDCSEHRRVVTDVQPARDCNRDEPDHHDGTEHGGHFCSAAALRREQRDQNDDRERHNKFGEGRAGELEPFNRRKDRNRRRDHGIAEKHRSADDANNGNKCGAPAKRPRRQRRQRQRSALAVIVGAKQDQNIFQRDRYDERPHDQRQHAEHDFARHHLIVACGDRGFAEGVKRAGSDVAVDDANATERQCQKTWAARPGLRERLRPRRRSFRWSDSFQLNAVRRETLKAGVISSQRPREYGLFPADQGDRDWRLGHIAAQGVKSAGKGGSSRISVMVTRRFGDI